MDTAVKSLNQVIQSVTFMDNRELDAVIEAVKDRQRSLRDTRAIVNKAGMREGTRVRFTRLSPKYLNGTTGTVVQGYTRRKGDLAVRVDAETMDARGRRYINSVTGIMQVPASALEEVE